MAFAYKLVMVGLVALSLVLLWRFMRIHAGPAAALIVSVMLFLSPSIVDQLSQGFWHHVFALGLVALFLGRLAGRETLKLSDIPAFALLYALIIVSHQFAAVATGLLMAIWLPGLVRRGGWRSAVAWGCIPALGAGLTFWYVGPILATSHWMLPSESSDVSWQFPLGRAMEGLGIGWLGPLAPHAVGERLVAAAAQWPVLLAIALVALLPLLRRGESTSRLERRFCRLSLAAAAVFLLVYMDAVHWLPDGRIKETFSHLQAERFLQYAHLCLFSVAAVSLKHLTRWNEWTGAAPSRWATRARRLAIPALAIALSLTFVRLAWSFYRNERVTTEAACPQMEPIRQTWAWLKAHNDGSQRILYETTYDNYPKDAPGGRLLSESSILALSALETDTPQAGALLNVIMPMFHHTRTSGGRIMNRKVHDVQFAEVRPALAAMNCVYVVCCTDALRSLLAQSGETALEARFGPFSIHRFGGAPGAWAKIEGGGQLDFQFDPVNDAHMIANVHGAAAGSSLRVSVAWHPYWEASVGGRPLELNPDEFGLIQTRLPSSGDQIVDFRFAAKRPAHLLISAMAWIAVGIGLVLTRKRAFTSA